MPVSNKRGSLLLSVFAVTLFAIAPSARADEIRLKDGRKLSGVIVAYEDNMFKIKTDYGYELIEKDKIESIIPSTPAGTKKSATPAPSKTEGGAPAQKPSKPTADSQPKAETAGTAPSGRLTVPKKTHAKCLEV